MYRHIVRPGISGWAQVVHGYAADADDTRIKIEHDFTTSSTSLVDVLIVFKTIWTIPTGFGARVSEVRILPLGARGQLGKPFPERCWMESRVGTDCAR